MKTTDMGRVVIVKAILHKTKDYPSDHRRGEWPRLGYEPRALTEPRPGWLVGERYLPTGSVEPGSFDDPPCFHGHGCVHAYAIVFWPSMAPVYVLPSDMTFDANAKPWPPNGSERQRGAMRKIMHDYAHQFPRDKSGRFIG